MDRYREQLTSNYSLLNQTTHDLYTRSIDYHFEQLFATLFPFVSKSPKKPRTFAQLSARYTRPQGIMYVTTPTSPDRGTDESWELTSFTSPRTLLCSSIPCGNDQVGEGRSVSPLTNAAG